MTIIRNLLISIVTGSIAYAIVGLGLRGYSGLSVSADQLTLLLVLITTAFVTACIASIFPIRLATAISNKETGTVKWFDVRKGYGFITRDQGDDIFVHFRNIEGSRQDIVEGQRVAFVVTTGGKGPQADQVTPA